MAEWYFMQAKFTKKHYTYHNDISTNYIFSNDIGLNDILPNKINQKYFAI